MRIEASHLCLMSSTKVRPVRYEMGQWSTFKLIDLTQNGHRIFYFIVARAALVDYDLLAFHAFQLLETISDMFDIVMDLTGVARDTELPMAWLSKSIQICPPGILPCISVSPRMGLALANSIVDSCTI